MKTYTARLTRVTPNAGPQASLTITVRAPTSDMARVTAEAQFPGYRCINAPVASHN